MKTARRPGGGRILRCLILLAGLCLAAACQARRAAGFSYDDHLLLPLRVHVLHAKAAPDAQCGLAQEDVTRILGKVNGIWRQAGIQFTVESRRVEEAADQELYQSMGDNRTEAHLRLLRPRASRAAGMFHVYYIHAMRPNGIYMGADAVFVKETAELRPVEGGIDEPLPRVTAHELGHGLDLPHRQDTFNLMASGTTGTTLNDAEIGTARAAARKLGWALTPTALARQGDEARKAGRSAEARDVDVCLSGVPGESPIKEAARGRLAMGGGH